MLYILMLADFCSFLSIMITSTTVSQFTSQRVLGACSAQDRFSAQQCVYILCLSDERAGKLTQVTDARKHQGFVQNAGGFLTCMAGLSGEDKGEPEDGTSRAQRY